MERVIDKNIEILHICKSDSSGAGSSVFKLHSDLLEQGIKSHLITLYEKNEIKNVYSYFNSFEWFFYRMQRKLRKAINKFKYNYNNKYYLHSIHQQSLRIDLQKIIDKNNLKPDIIAISFQEEIINAKEINKLAKKNSASVVFQPKDMGPLTGGCHFTWDCEKYIDGCGACPAINSTDLNDMTSSNIRYKEKYYRDINIALTCGSEELINQASRSKVFKDTSKEKIILGFDVNHFSPKDQLDSRSFFNLPENKFIIFSGAQNINSKRKGFNYLFDSIKLLDKSISDTEKENIMFVITSGVKPIEYIETDIQIHFMDLVPIEHLPKMFSAANLFVSPSIKDSGPMMIIQSLSCGTPVVSFDVGFASEYVINYKNGYKGSGIKANELVNGISYFLNLESNEFNNIIMENRILSKKIFDNNINLKHYLEFLREVINEA